MTASEEIDNLIAKNPDWRGETLAKLRKTILETDPNIIEEWKWMGSPVWSKDGIICVGNIFKNKVKLVFANGAALEDKNNIFNADLTGNQRRAIDVFVDNDLDIDSLKALVGTAISYNQTRKKR
jgi:hypothetical protein